jgi:hypothetical protein
MCYLTRYLEGTLKLKVNPAKSKVALISQCSFLGFTIMGGKVRWTEKSLDNFKHRINGTHRTQLETSGHPIRHTFR